MAHKNEWYVIVNPHAGSGKTMQHWIPAEKLLQKLEIPFHTVFTTHKHHATDLAAAAARMGYRKIMAVGGDGSVHEVFDGVLGWCRDSGTDPSEFYITVAPIGSGNDWVRSLGLPRDTEEMIRILARGQFKKADVVSVRFGDGTTTHMANIGGLVFDSHVCDRVNSQKERGMRSSRIYLNSLLYTLTHLVSARVKVSVDDRELYAGEVYDVGLGNGSYCGGGMQECGLANMFDGVIDVLVVPKTPIIKLLPEIPRLYNNTLYKSENFHYAQGRKIVIEPLDKASEDIVEIDGEVVGRIPMTLEVTGAKINVLTDNKE